MSFWIKTLNNHIILIGPGKINVHIFPDFHFYNHLFNKRNKAGLVSIIL